MDVGLMPIVEATYKHSKNIMDTLEKIKVIQLDIDKNYTKFQENNFKVHLIFEIT
jgi:preprotein translocase subunit SecB